MPSPFPGMDPFLEDPEIFPDFHFSFIVHLSETIQKLLPEAYYAVIGRREWVEACVPNLQFARTAGAFAETAVAVAAPPRSEPLVIHVTHDERREPFIEIYMGRGSERRLVTSIELLSLSNKTPGERGRDLYIRKQQEILYGKVHLVEIDLLRGGEHTTAVPLDRLAKVAGEFEYHVSIHRFDNFEDFFVYPIRLNESLPEIAIPLLPGDPPVLLDLQAVFQHTYNVGPYQREIDYRQDAPPPPLDQVWQSWLRRVLA